MPLHAGRLLENIQTACSAWRLPTRNWCTPASWPCTFAGVFAGWPQMHSLLKMLDIAYRCACQHQKSCMLFRIMCALASSVWHAQSCRGAWEQRTTLTEPSSLAAAGC